MKKPGMIYFVGAGPGAQDLITVRGANLITRDIGGVLEYYEFNGHGDVIARTNNSGATLKNYDYDAFGVELDPENLDANPFRYCGEYYDREAETYYLRARSYRPEAGQFASEDSVKFAVSTMPSGQKLVNSLSLNLYSYCYKQ